MPVETLVCVRDQLRVTELARCETDSRLTDVNSELERQRNDCDTLRDKLRQRQVTLVSFFSRTETVLVNSVRLVTEG